MIPSCALVATGGGGNAVSINGQDIQDSDFAGGLATAGYTIDSDGNAYRNRGGVVSAIEEWLHSGLNTDFEVRATLLSGDTPSGTLGSWLVCSSDNGWLIQSDNGDGMAACSLTVEIRDAASPNTVRADNTISLTANSQDTS